MLVHIIQQLLLMAPTWVEAYGDRRGDTHTDYSDIVVRGTIICLAGGVVGAWRMQEESIAFGRAWIECSVMSLAYFCGGFQYLVNWYERKITEKDWRMHLNETSVPDRWTWYRSIPWRRRMMLHGLIMVAGWVYYYL
jgi:hypothetical protein